MAPRTLTADLVLREDLAPPDDFEPVFEAPFGLARTRSLTAMSVPPRFVARTIAQLRQKIKKNLVKSLT
jgi:hypothetical protein